MTAIPDEDYALVTVDDLKESLNIDPADTSRDRRLRRLGGAVTSGIETHCGRKFIARNEILTLNGDGSDILFVDPPILGTVSIVVSGTTLLATEFTIEPEHGIIRLLAGLTFVADINNVVVTLRHGYERASLPATIEMAAILWAAELFKVLSDERHGAGSLTHGDESISFTNDGIPTRVLTMIQPYRLIRFGG